MEIGGFYEFPKLDCMDGKDSVYLQLKMAYKNFQMIRDGRQAIKTALLNIKNIKQLTCYLPAYVCRSILQPFQELNLKVKFYGHEDVLKPEIEEIKDSLLFLIDYFGRETLSNIEIQEVLDRNNTVILDATHSILNKERFDLQDKDYYITSSLRKMFPIPDGGILYGSEKFHVEPAGLATGHEKILDSMIMKSFYLNNFELGYSDNSKIESILRDNFSDEIVSMDPGLKSLKKYYLSLHYAYEREKFEDIGMAQNIPAISIHILNNISYSKIFQKRNENLRFFYKELEDDNLFLFDLKDIKSPFMLPLKFHSETERDSVKDLLIKNDIYPPLLWDLDGIVPKEYSYEHELRKRIMMIPIDHRYDTGDLSIAAELLNSDSAMSR